MYQKDKDRINKKIAKLEKYKKQINIYELLNKIKNNGTFDNLTAKELNDYIFYERLNYQINSLKLDLVVLNYSEQFTMHDNQIYQQLVAQYLFEMINNPIGYSRIDNTYQWINDLSNISSCKELKIMEYAIHTMDTENPIFKQYFTYKDDLKLIQQFKKFHDYFSLRYNYDYCHDYCFKQIFMEDIYRYNRFKTDFSKKHITYMKFIRDYHIKDYQDALTDNYVKTL